MSSPVPASRQRAEALVHRYTALAAATGAIPLPAGSGAIIVENAALIAHVGAAYGVTVTLPSVAASLSTLALLNLGARNLFVEGMRALNAVGGGLGTALVSGFGATTAGVQTWIVGHIAIAIAEHGGQPLPAGGAAAVVEEARQTYERERVR